MILDISEVVFCGLLEVCDSNDIDDGDEDTKSKSDDKDSLLLLRQLHARQNRHRKKKDGKIRDNI